MGDNGKMYVPEDILPVYRDNVIPLADIITPNQFEAELLTGLKMTNLKEALNITEALHQKGVKTVVISSSELGDDTTMIGIASTPNECYKIEIPKVDACCTGTGDLFAALFLAWHYKTKNDVKLSLENTIATLQTIVQDTYRKARVSVTSGEIPPALMELQLIQNKAAVENPTSNIKAIKIK
ncbi:Pyridoxal kinase [Eumeta japonica]|uniref:Pyridoxal kinase n=1 Tax=Eumeta variegata TaxID=151549 RepID=A0A4C1UI41_EUMVA|nr:Pyridoxal kinase [Eumeta japonica]